MEYTSLYRRYRPDTFDKVIGQDHIVRTLRNQIAADSIGHAYIFTGTRGTGKTSVAKIFAKAVNCPHTLNGSPCGECETCRQLSAGGNFDILEIDAASNNSVDQMRELTDKINFPPTVGRFKVYIIDEVHMLSKSAHNALLKTLEEPPSHAIFILATTEIHQIPATILSRCMRFDFRLVPTALIAERLSFIFDDIGAECDLQSARLIASAGNGSVRDALSIADMCVSYCNGKIAYEGVLEVLGASDPKKMVAFADALASGRLDAALKQTAEMCALGKSVSILAADLATLFANVMYIKNCSSAREILSLPEEYYSDLQALADRYSTEKCMDIMRIMSGLEGELRYSSQHRILFEAAVARACLGNADKVDELEAKIKILEKKINSRSVSAARQTEPSAAPSDVGAKLWKNLASELESSGRKFLANAVLESDFEVREGTFVLKVPKQATLSLLIEKDNRDFINAKFAQFSDMPLNFEEVKKLDDNSLPYIMSMFGKRLEIK